ncbi:MAG: hypothetical protein QOE02_4507, partial [Rhodospirillaceae bacterium]|nr:hypothetical protein [Rhodospirillaceae bacterium]
MLAEGVANQKDTAAGAGGKGGLGAGLGASVDEGRQAVIEPPQ